MRKNIILSISMVTVKDDVNDIWKEMRGKIMRRVTK